MAKQLLKPDLCIIGGGSGGLSVASAAAQMGVDVVLVEKAKMGGDCLNYGCVPSKALLSAAKSVHEHGKAAKYLQNHQAAQVNYPAVKQHVADVIATIAPHDSVERFEGLGVKVIEACGQFLDDDTLEAGDYSIKARRFIVATGSSAFIPPIKGLNQVSYHTNETIFTLDEQPEHLVIIGAGAIGLEMAQAHSRIGCQVTVIDAFKILANLDDAFTQVVLAGLKADGIKLYGQTQVVEVSQTGKAINIHLQHADERKQVLTASHLLVATGRNANIDGLGLANTSVKSDAKGIMADHSLRTAAKRIYAIGDVVQITGAAFNPQLTHIANYHAGLVIRSCLLRLPTKVSYDTLPWVLYTDPELAHVGLDAEGAQQKYAGAKTLSASFAGNDRAIAMGKPQGLAQFYITKKGHVVGATIVGENAGELISILALMIAQKIKISKLATLIVAYPTLAEIVKRAAQDHYKDMAKNKILRFILGLLRKFG
ncbi:MAG: FAD-dependent oxidoreductase [Rhizobiales bacterium]|nr:FAD-dependent oxidoreductase [Hyphomicrobiales bacterium]NRB14291.1 FAD-dependent oxidoreductase [Hyphomicrobiales bacterium]